MSVAKLDVDRVLQIMEKRIRLKRARGVGEEAAGPRWGK